MSARTSSATTVACEPVATFDAVRPARWRNIWGTTIALLVVTFVCSPNFQWESGPAAAPFAGDFLQEWLGGYIVRQGERSKFYDVEYARQLQHDPALIGFEWDRAQYLPLVYPPFYYLLVSPFSALPMWQAAWVWGALTSGCWLATIGLLMRANDDPRSVLFGWANANGGLARWLLPLALLFPPLIESLVSSQKGTVALLILLSTYRLLESRRPFCAGMIFGCLAFKPQLAIVIALAMVWKREWRFVVGGLTIGAVLIALSLSLGWDVCLQYVQFARGTANYIRTGGYDLTKSHCLYGFFALLLNGWSLPWVRGCTLIAAVGVVASLARIVGVARKPQRSANDGSTKNDNNSASEHNTVSASVALALQFAALTLATLLLSPHLYTYDLTLVLLPCALLFAPRVRMRLTERARSQLQWPLVALVVLAGLFSTLAKVTGVQISTVLMLLTIFTISSSPLAGQLSETGKLRHAAR